MQVRPGALSPHLQIRVAFLPFYRLCLVGAKPQPFVAEPKTLAEHLKRRRHLLGHFQREAADAMGINWWTYMNWEKGCGLPCIKFMPPVIAYLGYDPFGEGEALGERVMAGRRRLGETRAAFGKRFGVTGSAVWAWECDGSMPRAKLLTKLGSMLEGRAEDPSGVL